MNQNERFDDILNECLDRILKGETVDQCLRNYPGQAKELEPLLRTALAAKVASTIQPRAEFKATARYEFQLALRETANKKSRQKSWFGWHWQWQSGWAIAIIAIIVVVLGSGGTVAAASHSMPDNALYPVKLATEQVQLAVTPSDIGKAELNAKFADRRAEEIVYIASKGDAQGVQMAARRLNTNLQNITNLAGNENVKGANKNGLTAGSSSTGESNSAAKNDLPPRQGIAPAPQATLPPPTTPTQGSGSGPAVTAAATPAPMPSIKIAVPAPAAPAPGSFSAPPSDKSTVLSGNQNGSSRDARSTGNVKTTEREKLKQIIINNFSARQSRLEEALKKASPQVRPAVRQAIAQSQVEYEKALTNIEQAQNAD